MMPVITTRPYFLEPPSSYTSRFLHEGSDDTRGFGAAIDETTGDLYAAGLVDPSGAEGAGYVVKYDVNLNLQWQKYIEYGGSPIRTDYAFDVAVDPSGNVYVTGEGGSDGPAIRSAYVLKLDSSGVAQWSRAIGKSGNVATGRVIATDGSGNVYIAGETGGLSSGSPFFSGIPQMILAKYNSSGTLLWKRVMGSESGTSGRIRGMRVTSGGDIFVAGENNDNATIGTHQKAWVAKITQLGSPQLPSIAWQKLLGTSGIAQNFYNCAIDASGDVYTVGHQSGATWYGIVAKYNGTTGALSWQKRVTTWGSGGRGFGAYQAKGGGILIGHTDASSASAAVTKLDTNGNFVWGRKINGSGSVDTGHEGLAVVQNQSTSQLYMVSGYNAGPGTPDIEMVISRIPDDGGPIPVAGTYLTLESQSFSSSGSFTDAAGIVKMDDRTGLDESAVTLDVSNASHTQTIDP